MVDLGSLYPPDGVVAAVLEACSGDAAVSLTLEAGYSPSDSFIHLEQTGSGALEVGDQARFRVHSTSPGGNFYYEVIARGKVVFSDFSGSPEISVALTPVMAPTSRLVVHQILPGNEVAADYLPFGVEASYPMPIGLELSVDEARPGDSVDIDLTTQGPARVGLAAVDRSVFILAENRLNLRQVFAELERLYMQPQVELHEWWPQMVTTRGAQETFEEAGLVVMSNLDTYPRARNTMTGGQRPQQRRPWQRRQPPQGYRMKQLRRMPVSLNNPKASLKCGASASSSRKPGSGPT